MTLMRKNMWTVLGVLACSTLFAVLHSRALSFSEPAPPPLSQAGLWLVGAAFAAACVAFWRMPLVHVLFLMLFFIPLEVRAQVGRLPPLSPLDYFTAAAGLALAARLGPLGFARQIRASFPFVALVFWSLFFIYAFWLSAMLDGSVRPLLRWGEFLFFYFLARRVYLEDGESPRKTALLLMCLGLAASALGLVQFIASGGQYTGTYSFFKQHNVFAAFLSFCLPAAWYVLRPFKGGTHFSSRLAFGVMVAAFLACYSRGAWLGLFLAVCLLLGPEVLRFLRGARHRGKIALALLLFLGIFAFVSRNQYGRLISLTGRSHYWEAAFAVFSHHPWVGLGPGNYADNISRYLTGESLALYKYEAVHKHHQDFWQHLHSIYLHMLVEYGLLGFFLWLAALAALVVPAFVYRRENNFSSQDLQPFFLVSATSFLIHNTVDLLFVGSLDLIFVMLLALARRPPATPHPGAH